MRLLKLDLRNWCQHSERTIEFRAGLNGIIGSNGVGKSNLLDAIRFAVTGQSINDGNKKDNLTWGEKAGYVRLTFTDGNTEYVLKRAIESSKVELKFGDTKIVKDAEIQVELYRLFNANDQTLLNNVFVAQGKIDAILYARPTERLKEFQQTFGLDRAADAHAVLNREAAAYAVTPGLAERLQEATHVVVQSRNEIAEHQAVVDEAASAMESLLPYQKVLERALEATRSQQAIAQADQQLLAAREQEGNASDAYAKANGVYSQLTKLVESTKPSVESAVQEISQIETAQRQFEQAKVVGAKLTALELRLAQMPPLVDPAVLTAHRESIAVKQGEINRFNLMVKDPSQRPMLPQEQELQKALAAARTQVQVAGVLSPKGQDELDLEREIANLTQDLGSFAQGICPTCKQAVHGGPEEAAKKTARIAVAKQSLSKLGGNRLNAWQAAVSTAKAAVSKLEVEIKTFEMMAMQAISGQLTSLTNEMLVAQAFVRTAEGETKAHDEVRREVETTRAVFATLQQVEPDLTRLATLKGFRDEFSRVDLQLRDATVANQVAEAAAKAAMRRVVEAAGFRDKLGVAVEAPTQAEQVEASAKVVELSTWRVKRDQAMQQLGIHKAMLSQRESQALFLQEQMAREADQAAWVDEVKRARDILHVSQLPAMVMREFAKLLNSRMAFYLGIWEAEFQLALDNDLCFKATFPGGKVLPAARLSGGQKVVASASFRFAMSDTFARQVGLIVLDEPSAFLDDNHIEHLQKLLLKLKEMSVHSGRQILIVTHEQSLMGFLDHTVEVL